MRRQKTIAREGALSGAGLHTAKPATIAFKPAPPDSGILFFRDGKAVESWWMDAAPRPGSAEASLRCTAIGSNGTRILTVEHLLAALTGLEITNIAIDLAGPEVPGLDGSAAPFVKFLKELGIVEQEAQAAVYKISEPIFCYHKNKAICVYPSEEFSVSYLLDYDHPFLRNQQVDFKVTPETFEREIAPARTFCTESEAKVLREQGFGLGASHENNLVISDKGVVGNRFRFDDECARHKVLDLIGDLSLLGFSFVGRVVGLRSGHALNRELVERIKQQRGVMTTKKPKDTSQSSVMDIEDIKKVLPHRYPFLLVDRIVEMQANTIVAVKNVSANEPFFQGHFPQRAIMPGVLIVEAMAQAGGVLLLSKPENRGKLAYLAAINSARFRKAVVPGDQLFLHVEIVKIKSRVGVVKASAKVGGEEVCDAEFMFSVVD